MTNVALIEKINLFTGAALSVESVITSLGRLIGLRGGGAKRWPGQKGAGPKGGLRTLPQESWEISQLPRYPRHLEP